MISKDAFREAVVNAIKRVKDVDHVDLADDDDFALAGLDSLDAMDLVLQVENLTGLNFGEFDPAEARTINTFYAKAQQLLGSAS